MKTVFNNSQLCHIWASQSQDHGRGSNLYFEGTEIYSYGSHYLAAKLFETSSGVVALVNSHSYSPTTGQHLSKINTALRGKLHFKNFTVPNPSKIKCLENYNYFNDAIFDLYNDILRTSKITSVSQIEYKIDWFNRRITSANKFFEIAGYPLIESNDLSIDILKDHLKSRYDRYLELNTPEMVAKKEALKARKEELENKKQVELQAENISNFRAGLPFNNPRLTYELIRIKGNIVETSGKADVPLNEALKMLRAIENEKFNIGDKVGYFSLDKIENNANDKVITIGCHKILLSEAINVLGKNSLKLVGENE